MKERCSCVFCCDSQYCIDKKTFSSNKKIGVSGLMRVRNDEEFIEQAIDSCIDALDELVIVYNGCKDCSPDIIRRKAIQYKNKIRYYEYKPIVYATNLTEAEYNFIKSQPANSPHLLANYYNFGLSKVTYKYVMKIDADQIYFTERLQEICDAYRSNKKKYPSVMNLLCFLYVYFSLLFYKKTGVDLLFLKQKLFLRYKKTLLKLISIFKLPVFFSGYNVFFDNGVWYSTLGKNVDNNVNILSPFNGLLDHTLFRLSDKTYFEPYEQTEYSLLNSYNYAVIEAFKGVKWALPMGFMWIHLNSIRKNTIENQKFNFITFPNAYMDFNKFLNTPFRRINCTNDDLILQKQIKRFYSILHDSTSQFTRIYISKFVSNYYFDFQQYILKKKY